MDYDRIQKLIKIVEESDISGLKVEEKGIKIEVTKASETVVVSGAAPAAPVAAPAPAAAADVSSGGESRDPGLVAITSPMVGTFYSSPKPESPAYVKAGDSVSKGAVVCMVEAMKLFNEIESEVSGKIEQVLVENAQPVEYGQELFLVRAN